MLAQTKDMYKASLEVNICESVVNVHEKQKKLKMKLMAGKVLIDKLRFAMLMTRLHIRVNVKERTLTEMSWKPLWINSGDSG